MLRVSAPHMGRDLGPSHFDELPAFMGERPDSAPSRRSRKVVEYFWIPTDQEWTVDYSYKKRGKHGMFGYDKSYKCVSEKWNERLILGLGLALKTVIECTF